jgi:hypothetical protein
MSFCTIPNFLAEIEYKKKVGIDYFSKNKPVLNWNLHNTQK